MQKHKKAQKLTPHINYISYYFEKLVLFCGVGGCSISYSYYAFTAL